MYPKEKFGISSSEQCICLENPEFLFV